MPKKKKAKPPERVYLTPDDVEVRDTDDRGKGLFALRDLAPNSRLYYEGKEISKKRYDQLVEKSQEKKKYSDYVEYVMWSGRKDVFIDAHPRRRGPAYWLASRMNEPSPRQKANMFLTYEKRGELGKWPVLVAVRRIPADTELTFKYGTEFVRNGYKAGQKAVRPSWL